MDQATNSKPVQIKKRRSINKTDVQQFLLDRKSVV